MVHVLSGSGKQHRGQESCLFPMINPLASWSILCFQILNNFWYSRLSPFLRNRHPRRGADVDKNFCIIFIPSFDNKAWNRLICRIKDSFALHDIKITQHNHINNKDRPSTTRTHLFQDVRNLLCSNSRGRSHQCFHMTMETNY